MDPCPTVTLRSVLACGSEREADTGSGSRNGRRRHLFRGGDEHDALYGPGSLYLAITLSAERLMREAERRETVIEERSLVIPVSIPRLWPNRLSRLQHAFLALHMSRAPPGAFDLDEVIGAAVAHSGARPSRPLAVANRAARAHRGARPRLYRRESAAADSMSMRSRRAAGSSRRTLTRAFAEVLG